MHLQTVFDWFLITALSTMQPNPRKDSFLPRAIADSQENYDLFSQLPAHRHFSNAAAPTLQNGGNNMQAAQWPGTWIPQANIWDTGPFNMMPNTNGKSLLSSTARV